MGERYTSFNPDFGAGDIGGRVEEGTFFGASDMPDGPCAAGFVVRLLSGDDPEVEDMGDLLKKQVLGIGTESDGSPEGSLKERRSENSSIFGGIIGEGVDSFFDWVLGPSSGSIKFDDNNIGTVDVSLIPEGWQNLDPRGDGTLSKDEIRVIRDRETTRRAIADRRDLVNRIYEANRRDAEKLARNLRLRLGERVTGHTDAAVLELAGRLEGIRAGRYQKAGARGAAELLSRSSDAILYLGKFADDSGGTVPANRVIIRTKS